MRRIICICLLASLLPMGLFSQERIEISLLTGINIGGTASFKMPSEVEAVSGFSPNLTPEIGIGIAYRLSPTWSLKSGLMYQTKGMTAEAKVRLLYMDFLETQDSEYSGVLFTGSNKTIMRNQYLSIPLLVSLRASSRINIDAGGYVSALLVSSFEGEVFDGYLRETPTSEKIDIDKASYQFDNIKKLDYGLRVGATCRIVDKLQFYGHFTYGLPQITSDNKVPIKMHNIFGNMGISYTFYSK